MAFRTDYQIASAGERSVLPVPLMGWGGISTV
jgi:hypothetical protein